MSTKVRLLAIAAVALAAAIGGALYAKRAERLAQSPSERAAACVEHGVSQCPFCDPSLLESMGFCREHGVPEAICSRCRSDLETVFRAQNDWCAGHGMAESQCEACNPGTLERFREYAPAPAALPPIPDAIEVVALDQPRIQRSPSLGCAIERSIIRFVDAEVAERAGLEIAEIARAPLRRTEEAPAVIRYDATRHAVLGARAAGVVVEVCKQLGERVEAGDVLVAVDSAAAGDARSELLRALARVALWEQNHAREAGLLQQQLSTERDLLEAATRLAESRIAVAAARQALRNLGLSAEQITEVEQGGQPSSRLQVLAPFAGVVVGLPAVIGQPAEPAAPLVALADTSRVWVVADVEQRQIAAVAVGQPLLLTVDDLPGETFGGRVGWISTEIDPHSRTVKVRAALSNPQGTLRAGMFGRARIVTHDGEDAIFVPKSAVQWDGCCNVAFVQRSATEFDPHKLRLGQDTGAHYEVISGLAPGDRVVTRGSFLLKTELEKGSIGAGCCEVDHLAK